MNPGCSNTRIYCYGCISSIRYVDIGGDYTGSLCRHSGLRENIHIRDCGGGHDSDSCISRMDKDDDSGLKQHEMFTYTTSKNIKLYMTMDS